MMFNRNILVFKRKDAWRVKRQYSLGNLAPFVSKFRTDNEAAASIYVDAEKLQKTIDVINSENNYSICISDIFLAAISKVFYGNKELNRFIHNNKFWERKNFTVAYYDGNSDFGNYCICNFHPEAESSLLTRFSNIHNDNMKTGGSVSKLIAKLNDSSHAGFCFITWLIKFSDRLSLLPYKYIQELPFFSSVVLYDFTKTEFIDYQRHLNNFGTNSVVITAGTDKHENNSIKISFVYDSRIISIPEFNSCIRKLKEYIDNPILLNYMSPETGNNGDQ